MNERDMEDLIEAFPDDFFPDRGFRFKERQTSFAGVGRFDLLFEDRYDRRVLMELKAVAAKTDAVDQLIRYQDELRRRGEKNVVLWLVAPRISNTLSELLDRFGIEYREIHEAEFRHVAELRGFPIASEIQQYHGKGYNINEDDSSRTPKESGPSTPPATRVVTGDRVIVPSIFLWRPVGHDLMLTNPERFDVPTFLELVDEFEKAVSSGKNAGLVRELRDWAASTRPATASWSHASNKSLLRWVTTSSYQLAVPHAWAIWKYLFGEPTPTWYVWSKRKKAYEFDSQKWNEWSDSLAEARR